LRRREGAQGLVPFLTGKYGRGAALVFSVAILIRLFNEVWSNTAVVGGYYGASGSAGVVGAALLFTAAVLCYSLKGGLRSSIFSDAIQAVVFIGFLAVVLAYVLPHETQNVHITIRMHGRVHRDRLSQLIKQGKKEGSLRSDLEATQLSINIAALAFFYLMNRHTLSVVFERDLGSKASLSERLAVMKDVILRWIKPVRK